jgi:cytochrome b involved in lipid metabolism
MTPGSPSEVLFFFFILKDETFVTFFILALGFVYNVTAYFEFHPGGEEELSRGIGIDATTLFDQVSSKAMVENCL